MSATPPRYRLVLRYVYTLTAIVVVTSVAFIVALYTDHRTVQAVHSRIEFYHQASSALTERVSREARFLRGLAEEGGGSSVANPTGPDLAGTLSAIKDHVVRLLELQAQHGDETFGATAARLAERFDIMEQRLAEPESAASAVGYIAAFALSAEQLHRLHMIAAADELAGLQATATLHLPNLTILAVILGMALMTGWYVTRLLRQSLAREAQAELALAESRDRMHHMQKLKAVGQLVGGVAHDFNNLLTAILGQSRILEEQYSDHRNMRSGLNEINEAAQQAALITRQLLTFSRPEPVEAKPVDLNEQIRVTEPMLRRMLGEDIDLAFKYGVIGGAVELDPGQLHQVTLNLLINARDAMPDGGKITLATGEVEVSADGAGPDTMASGSYARLVVQDTGIGMSPAVLDRVFEPFFTTKQRGRGTGLGLSTVHGVVTAANGQVMVHSNPGEGTRFEIYWPMTARAPEVAAPEPRRTLRGTETLLVVEDEEQLRRLLRKGLGALGYRVLIAADGNEGLEVCRGESGNIDLILADVVMPEMSGAEFMSAALRLRAEATGLFMSGYTDDAVLQRGVDGAEIPLINKPFELQVLARLIRERLDERAPGNGRQAAMPGEGDSGTAQAPEFQN